MRKLPALALAGIAVAAVAGTAIAAGAKAHVMNVPLSDGSVARIEYVGDVAPKVTVAPAPMAGDLWMTRALPPFAGFDQIFEQMNRQSAAMMRQIQEMARQPVGAPGMNVAAYGNLPAGANSVSVVSVSNGASSCTRTTEVVSQGAGKPPKVTTKVSGNCGAESRPGPGAAAAVGPIHNT